MAFDPSEIDTTYLRFYLARNGWSLDSSDDRKEIWKAAGGSPVIVPLSRLSDYEEVIADAIRRIAASVGAFEEDVLVDISWPAYDKLTARTFVDYPSSAIPLQDALSLNGALRDLVVAAARSSDNPQPFHRGGWSSSVGTYCDGVRMIPSRPGSFVLRALLPLNPEQPDRLLFDSVDTASTRAVTETLTSGIAAATRAATDYVSGASETAFEEAIAAGVSADLLDALVRLGGNEESPHPVELGVSWTYAAPQAPRPPVRIEPGLIPVLAQGATILRGATEDVPSTITGTVIRLHREPALGSGDITVQGYVDARLGSSTRNMRIELDEPSYEKAIAAHRDGLTVVVRCMIQFGGWRPAVTEVQSFEVSS